MNRNLVFSALAFGLLAGVPARAADHFMNYDGCIRYAQSHPKEALPEAQDWEYGDGGAAAGHCVAVALIGLHQYAQAGTKLNRLAAASLGDFHIRASLYDQAGNAWLLAHKTREAIGSFTEALKLTPDAVETLAGRARARAMAHDWYGAEADVSKAISFDNNRADLLSFRAMIRRNLGHKTAAATDIVRALAIYPNYPAALVQRGGMLFEAGDEIGARKDWEKATHSHDSEAAGEAKLLLQKLGAPRKPLKIE